MHAWVTQMLGRMSKQHQHDPVIFQNKIIVGKMLDESLNETKLLLRRDPTLPNTVNVGRPVQTVPFAGTMLDQSLNEVTFYLT